MSLKTGICLSPHGPATKAKSQRRKNVEIITLKDFFNLFFSAVSIIPPLFIML
jgi:hypothetical protein